MTFEEYNEIQRSVAVELAALGDEIRERSELLKKQCDDLIRRLQLQLDENKRNINAEIDQYRQMFANEMSALDMERKARCVQLINKRDMATKLFNLQLKHLYPDVPKIPTFEEQTEHDIEPDVELDREEAHDE